MVEVASPPGRNHQAVQLPGRVSDKEHLKESERQLGGQVHGPRRRVPSQEYHSWLDQADIATVSAQIQAT